MDALLFTPEELERIADERFFLAKARIMMKVRRSLELLYNGLAKDLAGVKLVAPEGLNLSAHQFVKGEHLEDFPYQYLDFPKYFNGEVKFTYRSLFWWGHHFVFALILEGGHLRRYKENLINRYDKLADKQLALCLGGTPWEWKRGEGYTMELTSDRKTETAALLSNRSFVKLARFISLSDPRIQAGQIQAIGQATWRDLLAIITP